MSSSAAASKRPRRQPKSIHQKVAKLPESPAFKSLPPVDLSLLQLPWKSICDDFIRLRGQNSSSTPQTQPCVRCRFKKDITDNRLRDSQHQLLNSIHLKDWLQWAQGKEKDTEQLLALFLETVTTRPHRPHHDSTTTTGSSSSSSPAAFGKRTTKRKRSVLHPRELPKELHATEAEGSSSSDAKSLPAHTDNAPDDAICEGQDISGIAALFGPESPSS